MIKKFLNITCICFLTLTFLFGCQAKKEAGKQEEPNTQTTEQQLTQESPQDITVNDAEITQFIQIANKLQKSQQETRTESIQKIEDSKLGMQKYQQIAQAKRNPNDTTQLENFTDTELSDFDDLTQELREIQEKAGKSAEELVETEGMDVERYKEIAMAARRDTTLQQRLQEEAMKQQQDTEQP